MKPGFAALLLSLALAPAQAGERTARFYGYAYDLASGTYLYTEVHEQQLRDSDWLGGSIRYFAPDGRPLARKTLDFSADPAVPVYRLDVDASGYAEGITRVGADGFELMRIAARGAKAETATVKRDGLMAADSGFHSFIRMHLAEILRGDTLAFRMVVPGNLDSFKFRLRKVGDTRFEGEPAVELRAELDSLLRMLVDALELTYSPRNGGRLLEYRGPSNLTDPATGKPYNVRISYPLKTPPDAPRPLPPLQ